MPTVKIFGPKRSGTNLLRWILQHSPGIRTLVDHDQFGGSCWKHGFPRPCADIHFVMRKDITAWHVSNRSFPDPGTSQSVADWRTLNREYDRLAAGRDDFHIIEYADLLGNWRRTLWRIARLLGQNSPPEIPEPAGRMDIADDSQTNHQTRHPFRPDYYLGKKFLHDICPGEAQMIGSDTPGNPEVIHIKQSFGGLGDAVISAWVCRGLTQAGYRPVLYLPAPLVQFASLWWDRYRVGPLEKAPDWAHDMTTTRQTPGSHSHAEAMWNALPEKWTRGSSPMCPDFLQLPAIRSQRSDPAEPPRQVFLFPFSAHRQRQWPIEHWIRLARSLEQYFECDAFKITAAASPDLASDAARVTVDPLLLTDLRALTERISGADLVICNDSAPAHIAGTLGVPTLAIHAQQPPAIFNLYPSVHSVYPVDSLCAGCRHNESAGYTAVTCDPDALTLEGNPLSQPDPGRNPYGAVLGPGCPELKAISYSRVFRAAVSLLETDKKKSPRSEEMPF